MTSKVVPVFKNKIMTYFKVNQDKRIAYHHLFQDYINRTEPKYLSPFLMNSLLVLFQHDHGINPKSLKKDVDFLGQDFEFSKDGLSDFQLRSFGIRIRLYEILCGDCNSDLAIKLAKEKGLLGKSLQCLLLRIMHKEKGSVACYDWMKSLQSEPWGVTVRKEKVYALWHKESCNLLLNYLCKDKELDYARKVFEDMKKMDIPMDINSYNSLLSCDARVGNYPSALETFQQLREDVIPNRVTYNWMIHCALRSKYSLFN
jgi:pentatricopeptide repeat protein